MSDPNIVSDIPQYTKLAKEHRQLTPTIELAHRYIKVFNHIEEDEEILNKRKRAPQKRKVAAFAEKLSRQFWG